MRIKPRNAFDVGHGQGPNDDEPNYHWREPLLLDLFMIMIHMMT